MPEPVDAVFHLASPASPVDYLRLPLHTLKVGSYGTHNALGLAKFKRARFLLASTSEVYGDPEVHPQREEYWGNVNPVGPRGVYDEAKRYSEAMTMAYHRQQGVDTHIVRIFNTYGPRMRQHDGRAIPTSCARRCEGKPMTVFGDGSQTRSFCYVDDLIEGIFRLTMSDEHMPVNIGNPNEMTLLELARGDQADDRLGLGDRVRGPARGRPQGAPARTSRVPARSSAGSRRWRSRRACAGRWTRGLREAHRPAGRWWPGRPRAARADPGDDGQGPAARLLRADRVGRPGRGDRGRSTPPCRPTAPWPPTWRCFAWTAAIPARCCSSRT